MSEGEARVALFRRTSLSEPGRPERALEEIRKIVDAIKERHPERAAVAAAHHVQRAARTALGALDAETAASASAS